MSVAKTIKYPLKVSYRSGSIEIVLFDSYEERQNAAFEFAKLNPVKRTRILKHFVVEDENGDL